MGLTDAADRLCGFDLRPVLFVFPKMLAEIGVRRYALYVKQLELMTLCVAEVGEISRLVVPALAAIRAELELPTEIDVLKALVEDTIDSNEAITAEAKQYLLSFVATAFIPPSSEQK